MNETEPHWFAVYARSRHEKTVASKLHEKNIEVFLLLRTVLRRWKDQRKEILLPLFSSYVFVRVHSRERIRILQTLGVVLILSQGNRPVPIPEDQIQSIQKLVSSGLKYDPYPYVKRECK
jgi:transcription antitermination factor NusG